MSTAVEIAAVPLALFGHALVCVAFVNRVHSLGWKRAIVKGISLAAYAWCHGVVLAAVWFVWNSDSLFSGDAGAMIAALPMWMRVYGVVCVLLGAAFLPWWLWQRVRQRPAVCLSSNHTAVFDLRRELSGSLAHGLKTRLAACVPLNQSWQVHVQVKTLALPRLPAVLDGLSIVHLSDFHLTGHIPARWFARVAAIANDLQPDLIAITGDLFDSAECINWTAEVFGGLRARLGVYFVLGNHDLRTGDIPRVRRSLTAAGLVDLGGRTERLNVPGGSILLAGDERPWFRGEPDMSDDRQPASEELRLLLAHTPDRLSWARQNAFDLMLAGHLHGGQIRVPWIGPIVAPSRHGVRYACGVFDAAPTTLHVSRGLSSKLPLRINCPPEVTKLVLRLA